MQNWRNYEDEIRLKHKRNDIHYDNLKRRQSWGLPDHASTSTAKPNIRGKKLMLCIWWDQLGVVYYELLNPSETITGTLYRTQLLRSSRALKKKNALNTTPDPTKLFFYMIMLVHMKRFREIQKNKLKALLVVYRRTLRKTSKRPARADRLSHDDRERAGRPARAVRSVAKSKAAVVGRNDTADWFRYGLFLALSRCLLYCCTECRFKYRCLLFLLAQQTVQILDQRSRRAGAVRVVSGGFDCDYRRGDEFQD
ncbi:Mariner Mos1 transposase [Eumeta japonica]|uniref:Mariner Mos1 transposase n=1 Tax=Eumeta variegata TaxID=151549 RepID=A0A4C1TN66_EUMVA|nr:Mariner Mos1 transposase [Eumeta japonica]